MHRAAPGGAIGSHGPNVMSGGNRLDGRGSELRLSDFDRWRARSQHRAIDRNRAGRIRGNILDAPMERRIAVGVAILKVRAQRSGRHALNLLQIGSPHFPYTTLFRSWGR